MNELGYARNCTDPCVYYKWDEDHGLIVWLSFIDDMLIVYSDAAMTNMKKQFNMVDCDDIGTVQEYIGTKEDID